jgi:hypothetical protein
VLGDAGLEIAAAGAQPVDLVAHRARSEGCSAPPWQPPAIANAYGQLATCSRRAALASSSSARRSSIH